MLILKKTGESNSIKYDQQLSDIYDVLGTLLHSGKEGALPFYTGASHFYTVGKNPADSAGDTRGAALMPGSERSPGIGNGNPLQFSC